MTTLAAKFAERLQLSCTVFYGAGSVLEASDYASHSDEGLYLAWMQHEHTLAVDVDAGCRHDGFDMWLFSDGSVAQCVVVPHRDSITLRRTGVA